jgi:hypothetical protein
MVAFFTSLIDWVFTNVAFFTSLIVWLENWMKALRESSNVECEEEARD